MTHPASYSGNQGAKWGTVWWTLSIVLHVAFVLTLVLSTPLREWFLGKGDRREIADALSGPPVQRMVASLLASHTRRLREQVTEMKRILDEISAARDKRYDAFRDERKDTTGRPASDSGVSPVPSTAAQALGSAGPHTGFSVASLDIVQLYDAAKTVEATVYGTYRQLRAIELARIQMLELLEAFQATTLRPPDHPDIDGTVFEHRILNVTDGRLAALKEELATVLVEVNGMITAANRMLDMARGLMGDDVGATIVLDNTGQGVPIMGGDMRWGASVGPALLLAELFPAETESILTDSFRPVPGRKLDDNGVRAEWMYLDVWYIIGPFPNPERQYMDKKFPPESVVDLDATYVGKSGSKLKWRFKKSRSLCVAPHAADKFAIWYAYTEVYASGEQDRWCIFGSDDYSKVWIGGALVYASGKRPHHWIPDRGYRKVHFRKGFTPILLKLENAGGTTGFSMCIYLGNISTPESSSGGR